MLEIFKKEPPHANADRVRKYIEQHDAASEIISSNNLFDLMEKISTEKIRGSEKVKDEDGLQNTVTARRTPQRLNEHVYFDARLEVNQPIPENINLSYRTVFLRDPYSKDVINIFVSKVKEYKGEDVKICSSSFSVNPSTKKDTDEFNFETNYDLTLPREKCLEITKRALLIAHNGFVRKGVPKPLPQLP